jgi:hypothetical protein
VTHPL